MVRILSILLILISHQVFALDLAVMLFSSDDKQTSELYEQNLKDLGFKRFDGRFKSDYHTTIGYIDDVEEWDVEDLTKYLNFSLENHIKNKVNSSGINFEFGTTATLGKSTPCLVAIPKNAEIFIELNKFLQSLVIDYQHHKYRLKKITLPGYYVPHLSLNGQVYREIKITDLSKTMTVVNQRLKGKIIKFDKLVIR